MAVLLSPYGGVGAQFLDNSGNVLTGGKIFTYAAGTTTPQVTFTNSAGNVPHSNPIILDASGRVPSGEIWLTDGLQYKFVLKDSNDVLIATYDNLVGINSNFVNFANEQEIQTATAGQTVFTLTTMAYQPGTNSLSVFVDGVNQYGPGAQYAYVETDSTTITFTSGLHVGAQVKFTTSNLNSSAGGDAFNISYLPPYTGSVGTNVGLKLAQTVSVKDFGAVGDGVTDDTAAIQAAIDYAATEIVPSGAYPQVTAAVYAPAGTYRIASGSTIRLKRGLKFFGESRSSTFFIHGGGAVPCFDTDSVSTSNTNISVSDLSITGAGATTTAGVKINNNIRNGEFVNVTFSNCNINLDITDCWTLLVSHCDFQSGVINNIKALNVTQATFFACRIDGAGEDNVYLGRSVLYGNVNPVFTNCAFQRAQRSGINAVDVDLFSVTNCYFEGNNRSSGAYADIYWAVGPQNRGTDVFVTGCIATATTGGSNGRFLYANTLGRVNISNTRNFYNVGSGEEYQYAVELASNVRRCTLSGVNLVANTDVVFRASSNTGLYNQDENTNFLPTSIQQTLLQSVNNLYAKYNAPANRRLEFVLQIAGVDSWFFGRGDSDESLPGDFYIAQISGGGSAPPFYIEAATNAVFTRLPGPYADDSAAAAGGVQVGFGYRKTGGTLAYRVS